MAATAHLRILGAAAAIALGAAGCTGPPAFSPLPPDSVTVALGDSLTYGTGASPETSYPAALGQLSSWRVVNAGVPGDTAAEGCARLPDLLAEHRPRLVLVLLGGNDFLRRQPDAGIVDALRICVGNAKSAGAVVVLLTVPRLGGNGLSDAPLYVELGKAENVPVVDSGLSDVLAQRSLRTDIVHPNADGYRRVAERVAEGLRKLGLLRKA